MAGKEDEIKSAQKLAIKRVVYALVVFLVPWIVNVAIGLLAKADGAEDEPDVKATNALDCWNNPNGTTQQQDVEKPFQQNDDGYGEGRGIS